MAMTFIIQLILWLSGIQGSGILMQLVKVLKKIYRLNKEKKNCTVHTDTCHAEVPLSVTISTAHHPPSCKCCSEEVTGYAKYFTINTQYTEF
jgi:hypothetical protein